MIVMDSRRDEIIMIVGGGIFQVPAIRKAAEMGYSTLVVDIDGGSPGAELADYFENVSTKDVDGAISAAKKYGERIKAVFTAGTDVSYTVSKVAEALSLPGISPDTAIAATNKFIMRDVLSKAGVPVPRFASASSLEEALAKAGGIGYPLVIKPLDNMGARGVRKISCSDELKEEFEESKKFSGRYGFEKGVILEEYMEGPEVSIDTLVDRNGRMYVLTIADRHISGEPYFIERGHSIPSLLPKEKLDDVVAVMEKAVNAIGIRGNAAKADIKVTLEGAKIGEITARMSGGFHSQYTDPLATGMDSVKAALMLALGKDIDPMDITPKYDRTAIERAIIPDKDGRVVSITGVEKAKKIEGIYDIFITVNEGCYYRRPTSNIGKAGHIIAWGRDRDEAECRVKEAMSVVKIKIEEI